MKPDAAIYLRAISELDCAPERILFFDDSQTNVDGARAVGIDAHRVDELAAARDSGSLRFAACRHSEITLVRYVSVAKDVSR